MKTGNTDLEAYYGLSRALTNLYARKNTNARQSDKKIILNAKGLRKENYSTFDGSLSGSGE